MFDSLSLNFFSLSSYNHEPTISFSPDLRCLIRGFVNCFLEDSGAEFPPNSRCPFLLFFCWGFNRIRIFSSLALTDGSEDDEVAAMAAACFEEV